MFPIKFVPWGLIWFDYVFHICLFVHMWCYNNRSKVLPFKIYHFKKNWNRNVSACHVPIWKVRFALHKNIRTISNDMAFCLSGVLMYIFTAKIFFAPFMQLIRVFDNFKCVSKKNILLWIWILLNSFFNFFYRYSNS